MFHPAMTDADQVTRAQLTLHVDALPPVRRPAIAHQTNSRQQAGARTRLFPHDQRRSTTWLDWAEGVRVLAEGLPKWPGFPGFADLGYRNWRPDRSPTRSAPTRNITSLCGQHRSQLVTLAEAARVQRAGTATAPTPQQRPARRTPTSETPHRRRPRSPRGCGQ